MMKARRKNSDEEWIDVEYVKLVNSDIYYKERYLEFSDDKHSDEPKCTQEEEKHWNDIRERAAIAAMHGILCAPIVEGVDPNLSQECVAKWAVMQADALIKQLKRKNVES